MKILLAASLAAWLALPAQALEVGRGVDFSDFAMKKRAALPAQPGPDGVVWESGASEPVAADFKALLFQGIASRPGLLFEASIKSGPDWGPWAAAEGERFKSGRFWAKAAVSGKKGDLVRLRAKSRGAGSPGWIEFFGLDASAMEEEDGGSSSASFQPLGTLPVAADAGLKPDVQPRSAWSAKPATKPYEPMLPDRITVHHTESGQPMGREAAIDELQAIQSFHQHGRGWIDIGYHFIIDGNGQIWEGRPMTVIGAHVKDKNDGNVGISLMGDFHKPKYQKPTAAQFKSLTALARWLSATYGIPADRILGHRDQEQTTCPGDILYARLGELRKAVAAPAVPLIAQQPHTGAAQAKVASMPVFDLEPGGLQAMFDGELSP
ncbi:MAG: peptidoglycan recognition family protein [Elusimicrobia bacterium]|nr:peptidoglycan recognition family protein [Elusimicrobiota bacterium]